MEGAKNAIPVALGCGVALVTQGVCCRSHMVQMDRINLLQKQYTPTRLISFIYIFLPSLHTINERENQTNPHFAAFDPVFLSLCVLAHFFSLSEFQTTLSLLISSCHQLFFLTEINLRKTKWPQSTEEQFASIQMITLRCLWISALVSLPLHWKPMLTPCGELWYCSRNLCRDAGFDLPDAECSPCLETISWRA